jgi:hypothetical protein
MLQGMDGFDIHSTWEDMEIRYPGSYRMNTNIPLTTGGRFGGGCFRGNNTTAWMRLPFSGSPSTIIWSASILLLGSMTYDHSFIYAHNPSGWIWYCKVINGGFLQFVGPSGVLGTTSVPIASSVVWNFIEIKVYSHASAGTVEVRLNEDVILDVSGVNTARYAGGCTELHYYQNDSNGYYVDDWFWLDDTGTYNNDFLGDRRIETLRPNGDASVQFTRSGGSNNFEMVDDDPDQDGDSTYNESGVVGYKDRLDIESLSVTPDSIAAVQTVVTSRKTGAGTANQKVGVYSGTTESLSAAKGQSTDYNIQMHIEEDNPDDSAVWEEADITALQLQYEHA